MFGNKYCHIHRYGRDCGCAVNRWLHTFGEFIGKIHVSSRVFLFNPFHTYIRQLGQWVIIWHNWLLDFERFPVHLKSFMNRNCQLYRQLYCHFSFSINFFAIDFALPTNILCPTASMCCDENSNSPILHENKPWLHGPARIFSPRP